MIAPSGFAFNEAFYTQCGHKWVHFKRLFQAVAGDSEECSLGTAIHYQKIRGGGICDAFE